MLTAMLAVAVMPVTSGRHGGLGGLAAANWTAVQAQGAAAAPGDASQWNHITAGAYHTCGIRLGNTLWCWGYNANGELGIGNTAEQDLPQQVIRPAVAGWTSVAGAGLHTCALRKDTTLWCWGDTESRPQQVTTPAKTGWASVTGGAFHTCATRGDGTLWCWGSNSAGQLGIGNTTGQDLPQQVTTPAPAGWATVTAGGDHTCATRADGTVWCWGRDDAGQLGIGSKTDRDLPQQVTTPAPTGWTSVAAGDQHSCAMRTHALWCWGFNRYGQLGIGSNVNQGRPRHVSVPTGTGWSLIALGALSTCATHTGHTLWCWGYNGYGQLGLGNEVSQNLPQQVTS